MGEAECIGKENKEEGIDDNDDDDDDDNVNDESHIDGVTYY